MQNVHDRLPTSQGARSRRIGFLDAEQRGYGGVAATQNRQVIKVTNDNRFPVAECPPRTATAEHAPEQEVQSPQRI